MRARRKLTRLDQEGKILYLTTIDISIPTGPGVNEREFILALRARFGERLHVLLPVPRVHFNDDIGNPCTFLPRSNTSNPFIFLWQQLRIVLCGRAIVRREKTDVLVSRVGVVPIGTLALVMLLGIPFAIRHLGGFPDELPVTKSLPRKFMWKLLAPLNRNLLRKLVQRAFAADCCTSGHIAGAMRNLAAKEDCLALVQNATNISRFAPRDREQSRARLGLDCFSHIIGYCGGQPSQCGVRELGECAPELLRQYPRLGFVIVGDDPHLAALRGILAKHNLLHAFRFIGVVPYEEVPAYIACFDVGIAFDSKRIGTAGNSNQKIRQYLAMGKPVVATPGGNEFLLEEGLGSIVTGQDSQEICKSLRTWLALSDPERAELCSRATNYAAAHLSTEVTLSQRLEFWNQRLQAVGQ